VSVGFGIDLGAFGRNRGTAIVAARKIENRAHLSILKETAFDRVFNGSSQIDGQLAAEREFLTSLLQLGVVAVDVPIFLQGLPPRNTVQFTWELTSRPIDKAFNALPPLSSYLGFCVARFSPHATLSFSEKHSLVETYPAASLKLCRKTKNELREEVKAKLYDVTFDECDAVICALTAVADANDVLCGEELNTWICEELRSYPSFSGYVAPDGYRLLRNMPSNFCIEYSSYETWFSESKCN
jgi:hypothetical protein